MLTGLSPLVGPELLATLCRMGHGDEIVLADAHFPAHSVHRNVLRADGLRIADLLDAVLPLFALDSYVPDPVVMMSAVPGDALDPEVHAQYRAAVDRHHPGTPPTSFITRFDFYARARQAFAVVVTGETAKYGNVLLKKGVTPVVPSSLDPRRSIAMSASSPVVPTLSLPEFERAPDGVDPAAVPTRRLRSGARIPAVGLGTFGSDRFKGEDIAAAVVGAACVGYRHFDCASVYANEHLIGQALAKIQRAGVERDELWVTSKLWNDKHGEGDVLASCQKSLQDLQLDYLDLYLVHWPFPNFHAPGCDVSSRSPDAKPYVHESYMRTWRQMERLVERGLVRHIGTSNVTVPKLRRVLADARIAPACNEMELHPHFQQPELYRFVTQNGMVPIGFCPIGSPTRPDRDRTESDTVDIEDPVIARIAQRLRIHPATVCVKWAVQRGQVPIPFSVRRNEYLSNLQAAVSAPLTGDEMQAIAAIDRNCRLIKGQVFLWKDGQTWEALWDVNGEITPP